MAQRIFRRAFGGAGRGGRRTATACAAVFLAACGVRLFHLQDNRHSIPFHGMTGEYKAHALTLVRGDFDGFLRGPDPPSDANVVKHPPGYPLLMAAVYKIFGVSDEPLQYVHILLDASAAVLVLLVAAEVFPFAAAALAGLLVALSPQLAYHSIAVVPDPLAAPPILLAALLLLRARDGRLLRARAGGGLAGVAAAGALVGVSCLLRSNALLLPFFLAALAPLLFGRGLRLRRAATLLAAALAVIAPVTIRNAVVFRGFIPLSLSAGITLVEGIGVYDTEGRFGLPSTDYGVTRWEAQEFNRPDYLGTRFAPDGVERERHRVRRGLAVVAANPFWFSRVMLQRAASMPRLARVEVVSGRPAVTNPLAAAADAPAAWAVPPAEFSAADPATQTTLSPGGAALRFGGEGAERLVVSPPLPVRGGADYLLRLPLRIVEGSVVVEVEDARRGAALASTPVLHPVNWLELTPDRQPSVTVELPFVSGDAESVSVVLRNGSRRRARVTAEAGTAEAFALGTASGAWTRYPRLLVRGAQKLFLTALMLPLAVLGAALLWRAGRYAELAVLLVVPVYYMCVQSALWTEFRYILTMHYFLFALSAAGLHWACLRLWRLAALARSAITPR